MKTWFISKDGIKYAKKRVKNGYNIYYQWSNESRIWNYETTICAGIFEQSDAKNVINAKLAEFKANRI